MSLFNALFGGGFGSRRGHVPDGFYDVRDRVRRMRVMSAHREDKIECRVESLEEMLAAQALTFQALAKACLERGLFTEDQFLAALRKVDMADGKADGKLSRRKETR